MFFQTIDGRFALEENTNDAVCQYLEERAAQIRQEMEGSARYTSPEDPVSSAPANHTGHVI